MCIYVLPTSIPALLPCSKSSYSWCIFKYFIPFLIRKPTPRLPLIALSKLAPYHSYPLTASSYLSFRCVSEIARISGFSISRNCCILYFFATAPFTLTWMIFMFNLLTLAMTGFVILKNSSRSDYLYAVLSSLRGCCMCGIWFCSSCPRIHLLMRLTRSLVLGGPKLAIACLHICGKYRS